jgi:putative membrane protein
METKVKTPAQIKSFKRLIVALSIVIPLAVALLFEVKVEGVDLSFLPAVYATINGLTAVLLVSAVLAVRNKKFKLHQNLMKMALVLSLLFLVFYVLYHLTSDSTPYEGQFPMIYYTLLISHIILSVAVVPLVLFSYFYAWQGNYERHKKWTHVSFPIWLYVAVTGVVVYIMIAPYYG